MDEVKTEAQAEESNEKKFEIVADPIIESKDEIEESTSPGAEKRIKKLIADKLAAVDRENENRRQADDYKRQLEEFKSQVVKATPSQLDPYAPIAPTRDQYSNDPYAYAEAMAQYSRAQWVHEQNNVQRMNAVHQANIKQQQLDQKWNDSIARFKQDVDGEWDNVVANFGTRIPQENRSDGSRYAPLAEAIKSCDKSAEIAYFLGKNPQDADEVIELSKVDPIATLRKLWTIEQKLSIKKREPGTEPISPLSSGGGIKSPNQTRSKITELVMQLQKKRF